MPEIDISKFYVVTPYTNFQRWKSRKANYEKFREHMRRSGVKLITVELALGDRPFEVTDSDDPLDRQLRTWDEIWHKEAQINYGVFNVVPPNWEYIAWLDCDISFLDEKGWATEVVHKLQENMVVQVWETCVNKGPNGEALSTNHSFVSMYEKWKKGIIKKYQQQGYPYWHPGFGWAARREAFEGLGGLMDFGVVGHGDHHMALALAGGDFLEKFFKKHPVHPNYYDLAMGWKERADDIVRQDIGFVPGTIIHEWHGRKVDRKYQERLENIRPERFNPMRDVIRAPNGMWRLSNLNSGFRDDHRYWARGRNEDANET